ncbi:hypothetical protein ACFE04_006841 [Oxalis oulophora]
MKKVSIISNTAQPAVKKQIELERLVTISVDDGVMVILFDGHNGSATAIYTKENLLKNVISAIPPNLNRGEWVAALPRTLVAGFVKTDKDFQQTELYRIE